MTSDTKDPSPPPRHWLRRWACRIYACYVVTRWVLLGASVLLVAIVVSALVGGVTGSIAWRLGLGLGCAVVLPLLLRGRLRHLAAKRFGRRPRLGGPWFVTGLNALILVGLCLGFSDEMGRALRRRGDWFLGQTEGWFPRRYRQQLATVSRWLERFDLPPDLPPEDRQLLADAARPQPEPAEAPPAPGPEGPPPPPPPSWFHPLAGPNRLMPPNAACRFGAQRPGRRPPECELGHCGVDLFRPTGALVHAAYDGVVDRVERNAARGGIAGRYVVLSHKEGTVLTSYVHLDEVRRDLRPGMELQGGEPIGTVGDTGCQRTPPHLHFAVALKRASGSKRYIDPEPLLGFWRLPTRKTPVGEAVASRER